jgi:hypothetical protein
MPNDPYPFACGGGGQPACPPQPALTGMEVVDPTLPLYTHTEMLAHGAAQYAKGRLDVLTEKSVL